MASQATHELDSLFNAGGINNKVDFLNEKSEKNSDGIYRIDLEKVKDKKKGWRSVIRLLPNLTKEGTVGQSAIEKITHYVDIKNNKELSGWFDSAKNFPGEKCPLTDLYYQMINSKNAILIEKAKCLKYSKKYYSYCLVIEDEQQPELVGKIMIFQYGKQISEKIKAELNGDITGESCNIFDLNAGKDLTLIVKEVSGPNGEIFPEYNSSAFKPNPSSLPLFNAETGKFKNVPLNDGNIDPKFRTVVKEFLLNREHSLEDFAPKRLTEEQQSKITEISNFLTGKASASFAKANTVAANDFDFEEPATPAPAAKVETADSDDFFADF
jgi:hypothetical protein